MTNVPPAPPTPDVGGPSESEIIPFRSSKINILKSGILIPISVTAAVCIVLFSIKNFSEIFDVIASYLLFCIFYAVYAYSGIQKSFFIYIIPFAWSIIAIRTPIFYTLAIFFRDILPGNTPPNAGLVTSLITYFFGAGLLEELTKAIPALVGLFIALRMSGNTANAPRSGILGWLRVTTPLEGLMLGLAAGAGFIFVETLYQYVPNTIAVVAKSQGQGSGIANGFALLIPRVLQGVIGHMAWAGIFGYFIGLAARYPRSLIKLLVIGWLVAAVLHTFWDALPDTMGFLAYWLDGVLTTIVFVGCLLKAKQLETVRTGRAFIPTDSIIVGGAPLPVAAGTLPEQHATAWGGLSQIFAVFLHPKAAAAPAGAYPMGVPAAAPAAQQAAPQAAPVPRYILSNSADRYGIVPGQTIDLAMLFPGRGLSPGTLAEVTVHPQDATAIGLKNMTSGVWAVTLDTGAVTSVAAGRSVKLVANEKIKIGAVTIDVQAV